MGIGLCSKIEMEIIFNKFGLLRKNTYLCRRFQKRIGMKHIYTLLLLAVVCSVHVSAQVQTAEASSADSLINVVAYFCKNDTMDFRIEEAKHKIHDNDTTLCRYSSEDFRLIVRDSTSNGYKLEYISLGNRELDGEELDFLTKPLLEKLAELSDRQKVIFTIDEVGNLQHIENWREIKGLGSYQKEPSLAPTVL